MTVPVASMAIVVVIVAAPLEAGAPVLDLNEVGRRRRCFRNEGRRRRHHRRGGTKRQRECQRGVQACCCPFHSQPLLVCAPVGTKLTGSGIVAGQVGPSSRPRQAPAAEHNLCNPTWTQVGSVSVETLPEERLSDAVRTKNWPFWQVRSRCCSTWFRVPQDLFAGARGPLKTPCTSHPPTDERILRKGGGSEHP